MGGGGWVGGEGGHRCNVNRSLDQSKVQTERC